ncbi:hypothetical protein JCM19298_2131 [Nonlabens ulvanivorans]|nr:hypothetical protein JCM19298_2131 [Nonlabens ulvanivorans]
MAIILLHHLVCLQDLEQQRLTEMYLPGIEPCAAVTSN